MKIHKHLVLEATQILSRIFNEGAYSDKALEASFKAHPKWGARDRHFVAETVYESVRWWSKIWFLLDRKPVCDQSNLLKFFSALWLTEEKEIPEWIDFSGAEKANFFKRLENLKSTSAEYHAVPVWLRDLFQNQFGEKWISILEGLNKKADVIIRVNLLKTNISNLKNKLHEEGIETEVLSKYPEALRLIKRANVFRTQAFKDGLFEVQDAASQKVVEVLAPMPGERIFDACAGAGGKSLHLASRMKNKGKIISLDIQQWKLDELKKRARRNGVDIIETRPIENSKSIKRLEGSADALLLDVPCSGLGALRRNPDTKWKLSQKSLDELVKTQQELLRNYSKTVKPGGRMVYATCSVLPIENEKQIEEFLKYAEGRWSLVSDHHEWPHLNGYDGFYMALLKRTNPN